MQNQHRANILPELSPITSGNINQLNALAASEHKTHNMWLHKIEGLWDKINAESNLDDIIRYEEQIKQNERIIKEIKFDNMRENAKCLGLQINFINKAKSKTK